ncbi:MAG: Glycosyl transferase family 2 [Candidatus Gottesmanbacteria bacterium GW2011_GWB1_43_11]|uniref:Glycosyl transferase family 2 n=1 Tax=Candidatus Gottesmanbacteria bacterium GW2011_GWB1_43_11 TaxID=1618446 RepID=A0A0G1CP78_9BACT|nr:MAG: Glycosyl transferase family 2 [Candidatus Gottesmanbacteria bacterium GW2011_GWA2_42_16]KKS55998.1 MAG: Glycosyl transferase family 2 [Candidatus Gottesmanbacteria bacterium GW2011_GWA1_42_26]KKS82367.1 MAG: Glycosyl transferase family 2 [Candidatus Gottesmanbacteria bacterium GW2011_GWC1_43_10]KKS87560.1 MAG: Glycosyl transferase family 2 [Candidatus Gottesmanbacteria bacterium GW2011_GWB1_43_11]
MKPTTNITIGISAYNEEANIGHLLSDLLRQKQTRFTITKIVVVSDGSADDTVKVIKNFKSNLIECVNFRKRQGKAFCLDRVIAKTNSQVLVLLDADIMVSDDDFISKLVKPLLYAKADLTSAAIEEISPTTLVQGVLKASMKLKKDIFSSYRSGNNIYTCHGRAMALSRRLYKSLKFKNIIADDAFSYLDCKFRNYKYQFVPEAVLFYKLPLSLIDHQKQSLRFYQSQMQKELLGKYDKDFIKSEYYLPPVLILKSVLKCVVIDPAILVYLAIAAVLKIRSLFSKKFVGIWEVAASSKNLRRYV